MRVLGLDLETTGLDTSGKDKITELGLVLWETDANKPLLLKNMSVYDENYPELTYTQNGITLELIKEFGITPVKAFDILEHIIEKYKPEYLIAHNAEGFDRPFLISCLNVVNKDCWPLTRKLPWIDTRLDIPFNPEPSSRSLNNLIAEHGFLNPFPHRALTDVLSMLTLMGKYDFQKILELNKIPLIVVRALVDYDNRELAKIQRFSWEKIGDKTYPKMWVKKIRQNLLETEQSKTEGKFKVVQIE